MTVTTTTTANIDPEELERFNSLAHRWWDADGEFRTLHDINAVRLQFITDRAQIEGRRILEVGCGGGILTESLANLDGSVVGIDPAHGPLTVAKIHAIENGLEHDIAYLQTTAEQICEERAAEFHVAVALEMLEHVPDFNVTVAALGALVQPGGDVFLSTISRHPKAYAAMILAGEYVLNLLPRGTHEYEKFIKPSELSQALRNAGLVVREIRGYRYNPLTRRTRLCDDVDVNYLVHAVKPER